MQDNDKRWSNKEDELINQLFWELIITSPPCSNQSMSQEENELYWSEYYSKLETGKLEVYLKDSLLFPNKTEYKEINISPEYGIFINSLSNLPTKSRKFEVPKNPTFFNIKIITDYKTDSIIKRVLLEDSSFVEIKFSRIAFDAEKLKAYLTQSIMRNGCCEVYLICVENQENRWKVIRKININDN